MELLLAVVQFGTKRDPSRRSRLLRGSLARSGLAGSFPRRLSHFFFARLVFFFAVLPAVFFAVFVFLAAFFFAAIPDPPVEVIYVTYMVTYVSCQQNI